MKDTKSPAQRVRGERRRVAETEKREPLRRRLLVALGDGPAIPTDLARTVGARPESVSRKLNQLVDDGFLEVSKDADDRRLSVYSITRRGRSELGRHLAFGAAEEMPAPPTKEEDLEFLREALAGAVAMRRRSNRLEEAIDRLQEIQDQAKELGAEDLALEALAELMITQRQARLLKERGKSIEVLKGIVFGPPDVSPQLVYPAIAHLEYERGKAGDVGDTDTSALARHLTAATTLFEALIEQGGKADTRPWRSRRAWSVISLANNLREQSRYKEAIRYAAQGLRMFEELDDPYGRTQCWLLFGFCLRLLRQFDASWVCLDRAHALATKSSFDRVVAYSLVQMGEVRRSQGDTVEARTLLEEAFNRAEMLDLDVAKAFATSGIAATEFQDKEYERAQATLERAHEIFEACGHPEGTALNGRRQATVARHLSEAEKSIDEPKVKGLIKQAEQIYHAIGSPAGVAACEIERGWMRTLAPQCGDVGEVEKRLTRLLKSDERVPVILDASVPVVLKAFGRRVGGELEKEASDVARQARERLIEQAELGVQSVSEITGIKEARSVKPRTSVVEMGAEARRKQAPLNLVAA